MTRSLTGHNARLDHVGLSVPDLAEAVDFFGTCFGAEVIFTMEQQLDPTSARASRLGAPANASFALTMLQIGDGRLELLQWWGYGNAPLATQVPAESWRTAHVAIAVDSVVTTLKRVRQDSRVQVLGEPVTFEGGPTPGMMNAFVAAPWGTLIELMSWPTS